VCLSFPPKLLNSFCLNCCLQAYSFLEQKREAATDSCDWEHPESCDELDHLNDMAHQLLSTGSVSADCSIVAWGWG